MSEQGIEIKKHSLSIRSGSQRGASHLAQMIFLCAGLVVTLCAFVLLRSFVQSLTGEERARMSQDFVGEIVNGFSGAQKPLESLTAVMALSEKTAPEDISRILQIRTEGYSAFSQIFWFRRAEGAKGWTFTPLLQGKGRDQVSPDSKMLSLLLSQGVMEASHTGIFDGAGMAEPQQERQAPKIISGPFAFVRAVEPGNDGKGFVLGVVNPRDVMGEPWLGGQRNLTYMRIRDVENNRIVFLFERAPGSSLRKDERLVYEFPLAGRKWEMSSVFTQDPRSRFLEMFPYAVMAFGIISVLAGGLYIRNNYRQAGILREMNEALEQKNLELQAEISERERIYQVLQDAEAENRAVIDSVGDVIFETDRDGQLVFLNRAWTKVTGFEVEQSLGQELFQMIHPQDQAERKQEFRNLVKGVRREMRAHTRLRTSDGSFRAAELVLSVIQRDDGRGLRYIGTFTDMEERKRAEKALGEAEKKYRNIVENAAAGIYQMTPEGLFLSVNPAMARILGYGNPEQILREVKNANETVYIDSARRQSFYRELERRESIHNHEGQMRRRDGKIIWVNENARAVRDESGHILFIEGSIEDITRRKETDTAIREAKMHSDMANRAKSEFLSNMSHELRTPLNSIIGFSEIIQNEAFGPIAQKAYKEYAEDIHRSGRRLLQVINEILDISKIEAGERQLNEGIVDMVEVVDSALDMLSSKIENNRMLVTKTMEGLPEIIGEELALKQIVVNLLSNAVKFTPEGGRITISAHVGRDGRFHLFITDTGIGLDENEIKKALSPFGQLDNNLSRSGSGTGLGLTLVDALVKIHGGEFELLSQKGIGTTATVTLPANRIVKKKGKPVRDVPVNAAATVSGDVAE